MSYKTDIEIAQECEMQPITEIAARAHVDEKYLEQYGRYKAKVDPALLKETDTRKRQADPRHRDHAHARRRGQDHHDHRPCGRPAPHRQERDGRAARALSRPRVRRQGRRGRRRLCAGRSHGGHQPSLHRRLPRHRRGEQPARRHARQPHPAGQRARHRRAQDHLEALRGYERPPAPLHVVDGLRRQVQRRHEGGRLRHHGCQRDHGDVLPGKLHHRSEGAPVPRDRRLHLRRQARHRRPSEGGRRDDGAAQGRPQAEPGADAGGHARLRPRRPLREYRPRLQLRHGDAHGPQDGRLHRHGGRLRRRPRRGEVPRHQVPHGGPRPGRGRHRRDGPRAQDARRAR